MFIAFKALGATCLAGALATSGALTTDHFGSQNDSPPAVTISDPHATFEALAVGAEIEVPADDAGTATVRRTETGLEVVAVAPATEWTSTTKTLAADWLLVSFERPGQRVDLALDVVGENLRIRTASFDVELPTTTTEPPTTTTTEPPTTTTTAPPVVIPPPPVTSPPPVQPTVIPVAGAGTVVIVLQGPVVVIREVKVISGWRALVERRSGDINVLFRKGDRSFRFNAVMADQRLRSAISEIRSADRDRDNDRWDGRKDGDRDRWDRDGRDGRDRDGRSKH
jgi:hypothetical protein